jgi:two-component system alkaline phosphatase synthesis response regulator PhoP
MSHRNDNHSGETILVVEDDRSLRDGLALNLELHGYTVLSAADGEQGMALAFNASPDLIILDIMLPIWSGLEILDELRKRGERVPILILSAKGSTPDKVAGLEQGADDYLTKPFDLSELLARVEAMLRRQRTSAPSSDAIVEGALTVDPHTRTAVLRGKQITLTAKEFDILCLLLTAPGQVFSRDHILEKVWGWDYEGTARTVDNYIASLRRKLATGRSKKRAIKTIPRVGYAFDRSSVSQPEDR